MKALFGKIKPVLKAQAARFIRLFAASFVVTFGLAVAALKGPLDSKAAVGLLAGVVVGAAEAAFRQWIRPLPAAVQPVVLHVQQLAVDEIVKLVKAELGKDFHDALKSTIAPSRSVTGGSAPPPTTQ